MFEAMHRALFEGDREAVIRLVRAAMVDHPGERVLEDGLLAGMARVGVAFKEGDLFIPDVILAAEAMKAAFSILLASLGECGGRHRGRMVIGTVQGDVHDIGKNLVVLMLEGGGFDVVDLGVDVPVDRFVVAVREHQPDLLGMSALLTTTMPRMAEVIQRLAAEGLRDRVRVLVGGAPVSAAFAREIGADGYGANAAEAVERALALAAG